jgi:hypothetical protein
MLLDAQVSSKYHNFSVTRDTRKCNFTPALTKFGFPCAGFQKTWNFSQEVYGY